MSNWNQVSDFVTFTTKGITPRYVSDSSIIVLNQKCIRNHNINYSFAQYTDDSLQISETKYVKKGDILVNSTGTGTAGRCAFVSDMPENKRVIVDSHILILRCNSYYEAQCLSYVLFSFEEQLMSFMTGSSGQSELDKVVLMNLKTKMPSDPKLQQKIATVLSSLDVKIELNNHVNTELEAMAKTLFDYWFVQFDYPNANGMPYKTSGGKMIWNEKLNREIPEKWNVETLSNVISNILDHRGKTPLKLGGDWVKKGEGVIALSAKHVKDGKLVKLEDANIVGFDMYEKWMREKLREGDILMTSEAPLGEFYFILNDIDYCMSQRLFAIRADSSKVLSTYLYYELSKGNGYSQIIGKASGSTVFGIRQDELRKVNILKPEFNLQKKFDETVKPILFQIRNNEFQNQKLTELRDWLLPMLMNGQVKVN